MVISAAIYGLNGVGMAFSDRNTYLNISIFEAETKSFPLFRRFLKGSKAKSQLFSTYWGIESIIPSRETQRTCFVGDRVHFRSSQNAWLQQYFERPSIRCECNDCHRVDLSEIIEIVVHYPLSPTIRQPYCIIHHRSVEFLHYPLRPIKSRNTDAARDSQ